ncbi:MAG: YfcE family phosphodiesterase [Oscillospiraceae bacterium]|nr:YfcE family phosphodiesterase [Oscillospiraceae bacterium]
MKILIFSDSHRNIAPMLDAAEREKPDQIIHLGDHEGDALRLRELLPNTPVLYVPGNCDPGSDAPQTLKPVIDGVRFMVTHGHRYQVKFGLMRIGLAALEAEAQAVLFGHTHQPCTETFENVLLFNPGTVGGRGGTYGILETEHGVITNYRILRTQE